MSGTQFDVVGIGNAIVDVLARTDDHFLAQNRLSKGAMTIIDAQTADGKGVSGVAALAKKCGVPLVAAIAGENGLGATRATSLGIDGIFVLTHSSERVIADAEATPHLIEATAASAVTSLLKGESL